jgi:poly(A) polymerase
MNFKKTLQEKLIFKVVHDSALQLGLETYVIGGFVRDLLLKIPSKDIDFVCVGDGIQLAKEVARRQGDLQVSVFRNYGTAMLKFEDMELEFVGARKESYRSDSRKPEVMEGSLEDDQNRRDFTINALALSLNPDNLGELIDPFNGLADLKKKMIRTPLDPSITFSDDPLRMMRAVRFAAQLKFDIHADTFKAIQGNINRIRIVSQERITDELNKIILAETPSYGFKLLFHSGLLKNIFPEMVALQGIETINGKSHKDNFYHTLQVLDNISKVTNDLWLRWAAILHDIAKPSTKQFNQNVGWTFHGHEDRGARMVPGIFKKLKLPLHDKMKMVRKLVRLHLRPIALVKDEITDAAIRRLLFETGEDIEGLMMLCRADITSKNDMKVKKYIQNFKNVERKMNEVEEKDKMRNFKLAIDGEDIMKYFKLRPSKVVGEIKEEIKEAVLEGWIKNDYSETFNYMKKIGQKKLGQIK